MTYADALHAIRDGAAGPDREAAIRWLVAQVGESGVELLERAVERTARGGRVELEAVVRYPTRKPSHVREEMMVGGGV